MKKNLVILTPENLPKIVEILEAAGFADKRKKYVPPPEKAAKKILDAVEQIEEEITAIGVKAESHKVGTKAFRDFGGSGYEYKSSGHTFIHHPCGFRVHLERTRKGWKIEKIDRTWGENPGWKITSLTPKAAKAIREKTSDTIRLAFSTPLPK